MPEYKNKTELLDEMLEKLFEHLEKAIGHDVPNEKKNTIKNDIKEKLEDTLTLDDLKDKDVQKKLRGCMTAKMLGDEKQYKSLLDNLADPAKKDKPDANLDKKLKQDFLVLGALAKMLEPDKDGKKMSPLDAVKKLLMNKNAKKKDGKAEDKKIDPKEEKELEKQLDDCLRNLNGGANPTVNGGVNFTIIGPIIGNLGAYTNQSTANSNSVAFMVEEITYNPSKTDYLGLENTLKLSDLADGIPLSSTKTPTNKPV